MTIATKLLEVVNAEWERWGSPTPKKKGGIENQGIFVGIVHEYWVAAHRPELDGNDTGEPWSAAFISFCFNKAGAGGGFPYHAGHWGYCAGIVNSPGVFSKLQFQDPKLAALALGDIIIAARPGTPKPPDDFAGALARLQSAEKKKRRFPSHGDIVVEIRAKEIDVIGGNVGNAVTKTTYAIEDGRIADPGHTWLGVVKNGL